MTTTSLWEEFAWHQFAEPRTPAEGSIEGDSGPRAPTDDEWGRSESIDPDNVGDIADEGMGHRG